MSEFGFCYCDKTLTKIDLGIKELISPNRLQPTIKGRQEWMEPIGKKLEVRIEAEIME